MGCLKWGLGLGFRVWGLGFRVRGVGFGVWGFGVLGFGFWVLRSGVLSKQIDEGTGVPDRTSCLNS